MLNLTPQVIIKLHEQCTLPEELAVIASIRELVEKGVPHEAFLCLAKGIENMEALNRLPPTPIRNLLLLVFALAMETSLQAQLGGLRSFLDRTRSIEDVVAEALGTSKDAN